MSVIVFDFDGTLADSLVVLLQVYNELAVERGMKPVTETEWQTLRKGTIANGLKWLGINPIHVPGLLKQGLRLLETRKAEIKLFPGMIPVIGELHKHGHQLFVLSTNSQPLVQEVLNKYNVGDKLVVLKSSRVFGKAQALRRLMRAYHFTPNQVWMVGDEVRDMNAARRAGVHGLGVSWGFQPPETLKLVPGITILSKPSDILDLIKP